MKKIVGLFCILFLLGVGCQETKITAKQDDFERKQKCISYKTDIENNYQVRSTGYFSNVIKIFYSPVRNTCMFATIEYYESLGNEFLLYDYLSKEMIYKAKDRDIFDKYISTLE